MFLLLCTGKEPDNKVWVQIRSPQPGTQPGRLIQYPDTDTEVPCTFTGVMMVHHQIFLEERVACQARIAAIDKASMSEVLSKLSQKATIQI